MKNRVVGIVFRLSAIAIALLIASPCFAGAKKAEGIFLVTSPTIEHCGNLDKRHTCDGAAVTPELSWTGVPAGTKSFAVYLWHIAPDDAFKTYWVVYNIPGSATGIPENNQTIGITGPNDKGTPYDPMCSRYAGLKRYNITVCALSEIPTFTDSNVTRKVLLDTIAGTILSEDTLTFTYDRPDAMPEPEDGAEHGEEGGRGGGDQQGPPPAH